MGGTLYLSMIDAYKTPRYGRLIVVFFAPVTSCPGRASWFRASFRDALTIFASIPPLT
jgi:hypothetical protein